MNRMEEKIDSIFSRWQRGLCPGGQVLVRQKGKLIFQKNYGFANLEHSVPVGDETVFHVASVSKQVTVMCVLLLQEDGRLSIDDDVREYILDLIHFDTPVTIRQMMNNVSGIRDQWELLALSGVRIVDTITQRDALSIISKQRKLNFGPQSQYLYSNSNFTLLAEIIERLSGKTLNDFAAERIFKPLGMEQTLFKDSHWKMIPNKANSYFENGNGNFVYSVLNYGTYGATSLNTTASDFLKWVDHYKNPMICSNETMNIMYENPLLSDGTKSSYAGGLFVGTHKGHDYIEHGGADAAFRSAMLRFTKDDLDIVILSNTQNMLMRDAAFTVADVVFGYDESKVAEERPNLNTGEFTLEGIEGYYFPLLDSMVMAFEISLVDGSVLLRNQYGNAPLSHISGNRYRIPHLDFDSYFGENHYLKTKDKIVPLRKLTPIKAEVGGNFRGRYESDELDTAYSVIEKEGLLYLSHSRNGDELLYQLDDDTFVTEAHFTFIVKFIKTGNDVTGLSFTGGRVRDVEFVKI